MFVKRAKNENNFVLLLSFYIIWKKFLPSTTTIFQIFYIGQLSQRHFLLDPQYLGVYVCDSRIDFSPSQLRISRVGLRHTHHPAKGRKDIYHWPAILANRNFVNDVTSAKVGAQNHRAVGNAADVGWWKGGGA